MTYTDPMGKPCSIWGFDLWMCCWMVAARKIISEQRIILEDLVSYHGFHCSGTIGSMGNKALAEAMRLLAEAGTFKITVDYGDSVWGKWI